MIKNYETQKEARPNAKDAFVRVQMNAIVMEYLKYKSKMSQMVNPLSRVRRKII